MRATMAIVMLIWTGSLWAQYTPARDVRDAVRMLQETQRQIEPAITAVRDQAAVLHTLAAAQAELKEAQPATSFDDADKVIEVYLDRRRDVDPPLSRDLAATIARARQILATNKPILNVAAAREQLHHEVIHPLQRDAMRNAGELQALAAQLQFMQQRMFTQVLPDVLSATAFASTDAAK